MNFKSEVLFRFLTHFVDIKMYMQLPINVQIMLQCLCQIQFC